MLKPLSDKQLTRFKDAYYIVKHGQDKDGKTKYNNLGVLNMAAWIGENSIFLLNEIDRLREGTK